MAVSNMKKLAVYAHDADTEKLLRRLMALKCVSVGTTDTGEGSLALSRRTFDAECTEAERKVESINEAMSLIAKRTKRKKPLLAQIRTVDRDAFRRDGSYAAAWSAVGDILETSERARGAAVRLAAAESRIRALTPWLSYDLPLNLEHTQKTNILLGSVPATVSDGALDGALAPFAAGTERVCADKSNLYLSVSCLPEEEEEVLHALSGVGFVRVSFRQPGDAMTAEAAVAQAATARGQCEAEIRQAETHLDTLAENLDALEALYDVESTTLAMYRVRRRLASTASCSVLSCWVPTERAARVEKVLDGFDCAFEWADPAPGEEAPILLRNNGFAKNFEWVLGMYSYPRYGSFDPTFIMSIFYFLIFGLMFADVGYGLVVSLVCFLAVRFLHPKEGLKRALLMFGYCGISQILMGVIFASYFGDFLSYFFGDALVITFDFLTGNGPIYFLIVSLGAGAVHLIAGMIVNFVCLCRKGQVGDAVFDVLSWLLVFAGAGFALGLSALWAPAAVIGYVLIGLGVGIIVVFAGREAKNPVLRFGKGLLGLYGGVNYVSDLLSYSRIMALGLASAVIAKVVNQIAFMVSGSFIGLIFTVLILIIGHLLNLVINLLGTFVHTSRLQYIEFFGKFYEDGGTPFRADTPSEKYTAEPEGPADKP